jgi:gamma-tubulin complex component 3
MHLGKIIYYSSESLSKPAQTIYRHNLSATLESALRSCSVDPLTISRLDVRLLEASSGESGWDIFTLDYHVDAPITTVITPLAMNAYQKLFTFLWRIKRTEHVLASNWRRQSTHSNLFSLQRFKSIFHSLHLLASEMIHFVKQLEHYILYEGIESAWGELQNFIETSGDLDQIIGAHHKYINRITINALLVSNNNSNIMKHIIALFENVLSFDCIQNDVYKKARDEHNGLNVTTKSILTLKENITDCADCFHVKLL